MRTVLEGLIRSSLHPILPAHSIRSLEPRLAPSAPARCSWRASRAAFEEVTKSATSGRQADVSFHGRGQLLPTRELPVEPDSHRLDLPVAIRLEDLDDVSRRDHNDRVPV